MLYGSSIVPSLVEKSEEEEAKMMNEEANGPPSFLENLRFSFERKWQEYKDRSTIYTKGRWGSFAALLLIYCVRVYMLNGWFIITYGLGIYLLNLLIGFLSPAMDSEQDGPLLPTKDGEIIFTRRFPEFKCW